jgi:hypothetical protein
MSYPPITSQDSYLLALEAMDSGDEGARAAVLAYQRASSAGLGRFHSDSAGTNTPIPSMVSPPHVPMQLDEPGPSNSPEFLPVTGFQGDSHFTAQQCSTTTTRTEHPDGTVSVKTLVAHNAACGAVTTPLPPLFPPGKKLAKKKALPGTSDLSVFDILNIFRRRWFLSADHLRAQALSAQKAEDGKIFWVEFSPQFHAHLVKCAVALVPRPISKVKKVMFGFILELLNGEGPHAFFDLTKGDRRATAAQKEKKRLARKRNRASRRERRRLAEEAVEGRPQRQCAGCGRKFASRKAAKRHRCPRAKGAVRGALSKQDKGKTAVKPAPNEPVHPTPPIPSSTPAPPATTSATRTAKKKRPRAPSSAREAAISRASDTMDRAFHSSTPLSGPTSTRKSTRLDTSKKRRIRKGVMESVEAHNLTR